MSRLSQEKLLMVLMDMTFLDTQIVSVLLPVLCTPSCYPTHPSVGGPECIGQHNYSWPAVSTSVALRSICSPFTASVRFQEKMSRYFFFCVSTLLFLIRWKSAVTTTKRNEGEQSNCFLEEEMEDIIIHVTAVSQSRPRLLYLSRFVLLSYVRVKAALHF